MNITLTMIVAAVAYLGLAFNQFQNVKNSYGWPVLMPFPLWMVASFHVLLLANIFTRNQSIASLEKRLYTATKLRAVGVKQCKIGAESGRDVMDWKNQSGPFRALTSIIYGGVLGILFVFTIFCLWNAHAVRGWTILFNIFIVVYFVMAVSLAAGVATALKKLPPKKPAKPAVAPT